MHYSSIHEPHQQDARQSDGAMHMHYSSLCLQMY